MSKLPKPTARAKSEKIDELPDAILEKVAGGGLTGMQAEEPTTANRDGKQA